MKIVLTGGCTGGHIYPALAIGDKFREMNPDNEIIYIAHPYGLETSIVPAAGYDLKLITAEWMRRDNPIRMLQTLFGTGKGCLQAMRIMKKFRPDVIMSTGSFVSVPVVLAGHLLGIKIYMHEQNGFPGVSNRSFARYAERIFLGFADAGKYFKDQSKLVYTGNPVRREFYGRDRNKDREKLGIPADDFVITVFGGSLGSETTNAIGEAVIRQYGGKPGYTIIFGTGKEYYDELAERFRKEGLADFGNVRMTPYISGMSEIMSAGNLIVSRAGALSVAETTMSGRAAVFVPSPNVTADHQYYNAKAVADAGGAVIVREDEDTAEKVLAEITRLESSRELISEMERRSFALAPDAAADIIYNTIMETYR